MVNVCFIGHFGGKEAFQDGQTVKSLSLVDALSGTFSDKIHLRCVDTYYYKRNPVKFTFQLLGGLFSSKRVLLCVSKGGRKVFFPFLYWCSRIFRMRVYHCAIGGRLAEEAREKENWKRYLQEFRVNWVESRWIVDDLQQQGVTNAEYLPNFKKLPVLTEADLAYPSKDNRKFCVFSRVTKEKGVSDAIESVAGVNVKLGKTAATLDIYGPIDPNYADELNALLAQNSNCARYCGIAAPGDSVSVLKNYDALLFPTFWRGEGIPGTVIDALCAGAPIIARWWKCCDEMLTHGYNGFCYPFDAPEQLVDWVERAVEDPETLFAMKKNCLASAEAYRMETVAPVICGALLAE